MPQESDEGYDAFFAQQKKEKAWGLVIFRLKDGEVVQVKLETSYRSVTDVLKRRSTATLDDS